MYESLRNVRERTGYPYFSLLDGARGRKTNTAAHKKEKAKPRVEMRSTDTHRSIGGRRGESFYKGKGT